MSFQEKRIYKNFQRNSQKTKQKNIPSRSLKPGEISTHSLGILTVYQEIDRKCLISLKDKHLSNIELAKKYYSDHQNPQWHFQPLNKPPFFELILQEIGSIEIDIDLEELISPLILKVVMKNL